MIVFLWRIRSLVTITNAQHINLWLILYSLFYIVLLYHLLNYYCIESFFSSGKLAILTFAIVFKSVPARYKPYSSLPIDTCSFWPTSGEDMNAFHSKRFSLCLSFIWPEKLKTIIIKWHATVNEINLFQKDWTAFLIRCIPINSVGSEQKCLFCECILYRTTASYLVVKRTLDRISKSIVFLFYGKAKVAT